MTDAIFRTLRLERSAHGHVLTVLLHRPEVYTPEDPELQGLAEVIVAKNRNGPVGIVRLTWRKEFLRFENFSGAAEPQGGYRFGSDDEY